MRSWDRAKPETSWPSPGTLARIASVPDRPWGNVGKIGRCNATITTDVISPNLQLLKQVETLCCVSKIGWDCSIAHNDSAGALITSLVLGVTVVDMVLVMILLCSQPYFKTYQDIKKHIVAIGNVLYF